MKIRMEKQCFFSSELTDEKKTEIKARMDEFSKGWEQKLVGDKRKEIIDEFLKILDPERVKTLEVEIERLHSIKDKERFRVQVVMLMIDAFYGGVLAMNSEEPGHDAKAGVPP